MNKWSQHGLPTSGEEVKVRPTHQVTTGQEHEHGDVLLRIVGIVALSSSRFPSFISCDEPLLVQGGLMRRGSILRRVSTDGSGNTRRA
jgi:hypothetical protein